MERIPIFTMGDILLVMIQTDVHDRLLESLQGDVGAKICDTGARGVLIDISALEVIDHFMARQLERIAALTRLLGAESILIGMRPAVAVTLMELGMTLEDVPTAVNVENGMDRLRARMGSSVSGGENNNEDDGQETEPSEECLDHADRAGFPQD
ncbi:MAG: STAS domain-containing protein [Rhodoplanes sp.]